MLLEVCLIKERQKEKSPAEMINGGVKLHSLGRITTANDGRRYQELRVEE